MKLFIMKINKERLRTNVILGVFKYILIVLLCIGLGDVVADIIGDSWLGELVYLLLSQVLVIYFFWKRRYANFSFKLNFSFSDIFSLKKLYIWVTVACVGCVLFDLMLQEILPIEAWDTMFNSVEAEPSSYIVFDILALCLFAPLVEEAVCRGAIERRLLERFRNPWIAIVISAIIFSAMHLNLTQGITFLGILLGWVYYCTRNLWPCIFIHALNNILIILSGFIYDTSVSLGFSIPILVASIAILYYSMRQIGRITKMHNPSSS